MPAALPVEQSTDLESLDSYARLIKALLPRAALVALFDRQGQMRWSSESTVGPDLLQLVEENLANVRAEDKGIMRELHKDEAAYLNWLRDPKGALSGVIVIVVRRAGSVEHRGFGFVHSLVRPALECLARELELHNDMGALQNALSARDQDVQLLLDVSQQRDVADGANDLRTLLQSAATHLGAAVGALIVPDKSLVLIWADPQSELDRGIVARTHRQILTLVQSRRESVIANRLAGVDGERNQARIMGTPLRHASGRVVGVLALYRSPAAPGYSARDTQLGELLARRAVALIESSYDATSGLLSRPAFEQRLRGERAQGAAPASWSLLYVDVDQLHAVNENFGMHMGDRVIAQLGELIRSKLPPRGLGSRIAGDRFAIAVPSKVEAAAEFGEVLRSGAEQLSSEQGAARLFVSLSIGVAPLEEGDLAHCLAEAESACKAAKDRGRNRVELYQEADASIVRRFTDISAAGDLRAAIAENRLRLDAQLILPISDTVTHQVHFELLLRMFGEDGQTVGPDRFLSAAHRYQLMPKIDRWVLSEAIRLLQPHASELAAGKLVFTVNISGQSLLESGFCDAYVAAIESSGLPPEGLCIELTESAAVGNIEQAELFMRRLRAMGVGVALDDFGTGLSSLAYLRSLPVTMLKIDGSFVRDVVRDPRSESMVQAIAALARSMSLVTVAEYVETEELRDRIASLGVDYGQGFAIGRPTPLTDVLADLSIYSSATPVTQLPTSDETARSRRMH
ncbi:MAG: GGDEF domain-containing protein [Steroidobacteraceae bacterium]